LATFAIHYKNLQIHLFFTLSLGLISPPNLSFSDIHKIRKFLLSRNMKCWNSIQNAKFQHGSSIGRKSENIVVEAPKIKEVKGETQKTIKIDGFQRSPPPNPWMLMCFLAGFLWVSPYLWPNSRYWCYIFLTLRIPPLCINILDSKGQDNLARGSQGTGGALANHKLLNQEVARNRFDGYLAMRFWLRRLYVFLNLRLLSGGPQWSWTNCGIIFWKNCGSHHVIHCCRVELCETTRA
jgi:hypothetical protein